VVAEAVAALAAAAAVVVVVVVVVVVFVFVRMICAYESDCEFDFSERKCDRDCT